MVNFLKFGLFYKLKILRFFWNLMYVKCWYKDNYLYVPVLPPRKFQIIHLFTKLSRYHILASSRPMSALLFFSSALRCFCFIFSWWWALASPEFHVTQTWDVRTKKVEVLDTVKSAICQMEDQNQRALRIDYSFTVINILNISQKNP